MKLLFTRNFLHTVLIASLLVQSATSQKAPPPPNNNKGIILTALQDELVRAQKILKTKGDPPPYLISYQVYETSQTAITAQYGALQSSDSFRGRFLDVDVRVGDYQLDNTHRAGGGGGNYGGGGAQPISSEDDLDAIKSSIWMVTDQKYKAAQERLIQIKADRAVKVEEEDKSADLSKEIPQVAVTAETCSEQIRQSGVGEKS